MILDTVAISALFENDPGVSRVMSERDQHHIPAIVLGEYRFGLFRSKIRKTVEPLLDHLEQQSEVLDVGRATARVYAGVREKMRLAGTPMADNDLWIASLAIEHGLPLLSRDEDFDRVAGVRRIGW